MRCSYRSDFSSWSKNAKLVTREHVSLMKAGAAIVDVSVDQGGCVETTRPTTHDNPIYQVGGIVHYCVSNMPGAVALTSTLALTNHTLVFGLEIADRGLTHAISKKAALQCGINLCKGHITNKAVAGSLGLTYQQELTEDLIK